MIARKHIAFAVACGAMFLLLCATLTNVFDPLTAMLPTHSHLLFHLVAHAVLTMGLLHAVPNQVPAEAICAISVCVAFAIEALQSAFVRDRRADLTDVTAATVGSFIIFVLPRDGSSFVRPSWQALMSYVAPADQDDDEEDSHGVGSWAV